MVGGRFSSSQRSPPRVAAAKLLCLTERSPLHLFLPSLSPLQLHIERTRELMGTEFAALVGESYERAYTDMVRERGEICLHSEDMC